MVLCRETLVEKLDELLYGDTLPPSIFVYGDHSVGKSLVVEKVLENEEISSVFVSCIECGSGKELYSTIIYDFCKEWMRIEGVHEFIFELQKLEIPKAVIVLKYAERLRDMEANVLQSFIELQQLSSLNVCVLLISQLPFDKFHTKESSEEPIQIYFPTYSKSEVSTILLSLFDPSGHEIEDAKSLFSDYLSLCLNTFFKACRDLNELQYMTNKYFPKYYEPIVEGFIGRKEVQRLWKHISEHLRKGMSQIYMRVKNYESTFRLTPESFELPRNTKYLLIAGFLASHNDSKDDKRLFMKNHGKQRKRAKDVHKVKVEEKSKLMLGPKSFSIDRLLAIFYAIVDEKVPLSCLLLAQINTLTKLELLRMVSGENAILEGGARLQCGVGLDFIVPLCKGIDFDIIPYLATFS